MKRTKKLLSLLLALALCLTLAPVSVLADEESVSAGATDNAKPAEDAAEAETIEAEPAEEAEEPAPTEEEPAPTLDGVSEVASGTCGDNVTWKLTDDGTLTISGTGDMSNYGYGNYSPWYDSRDSVKAVVIESGVTSIGNSAFYYCESLSLVTIPDGVTSIGSCSFNCCRNLTSVTIPASVTSIGDGAFDACYSLTSITLPDSVTSIGDSAFYCCVSLTSFTIPEGVKSIGRDVFHSCESLTSVTIREGVTSIGDSAFYKCYSLASVTIPYSMTRIEGLAFDGCDSLKDVYYGGAESDWNEISKDRIGDLMNATIHYAGHPHTLEKVEAVEATCETQGNIEYWSCPECGRAFADADGMKGIKETVIPATGHDWDSGEVTKDASCVEDGVMTYTCTICGATKTEPIPAIGHDLQLVDAVPASQTAEGVMEHYECVRCGALFKDAKSAVPMTAEELTIPKIEVKEDITITEDLKDKDIQTEEDVREKLEEAAEDKGYDRKNTLTVEVTLPQNQQPDALIGISILLPYPEGTDMEHFDFDVFHMISTGDKAGQTELVICTKTEYGLMITVFSLSPFTIAWEPVLDGKADTSAYFLANGMAAEAAKNLRLAVGLDG